MLTATLKYTAFAAAICFGSMISQTAIGGEPAGAVKLTDVALSDAGQLAGKTVDQNGAAVAGQQVRIVFQKRVVATAISDRSGGFIVQKLRGGVHTVRTAFGDETCRFWTVKAAPPAAKKHLVLVCDKNAVRAQCADEPFGTAASSTNGLLLGSGGAVIGGVLGAVIGFNYALDRDVAPPASP